MGLFKELETAVKPSSRVKCMFEGDPTYLMFKFDDPVKRQVLLSNGERSIAPDESLRVVRNSDYSFRIHLEFQECQGTLEATHFYGLDPDGECYWHLEFCTAEVKSCLRLNLFCLDQGSLSFEVTAPWGLRRVISKSFAPGFDQSSLTECLRQWWPFSEGLHSRLEQLSDRMKKLPLPDAVGKMERILDLCYFNTEQRERARARKELEATWTKGRVQMPCALDRANV